MKPDLFQSSVNRRIGESVVFEDDGRTGYAYWWKPGAGILSDVWLYNRAPSPDEIEAPNKESAPLNAARYVAVDVAKAVPFPEVSEEVEIFWQDDLCAEILARGVVIGRIHRNEKPGYSIYSSRSGPLAKPLIID